MVVATLTLEDQTTFAFADNSVVPSEAPTNVTSSTHSELTPIQHLDFYKFFYNKYNTNNTLSPSTLHDESLNFLDVYFTYK